MTLKDLRDKLAKQPATWLVTGAAGFIGSHLIEFLLNADQKVHGLDNFSTGTQDNLDDVKARVGDRWSQFKMFRGEISAKADCDKALQGVDYVLHHAALGSVPLSIDKPLATFESNVMGFTNLLYLAHTFKVKRFVYASSSAVYGEGPEKPRHEEERGAALSPYALSKQMNEDTAEVFSRVYNFHAIGLRYFNIFGPRQSPDGAYAAVIPKWLINAIQNESLQINGDGSTVRDFCFVENVVQANMLAALAPADIKAEVFNIAAGEQTTLKDLANEIKNAMSDQLPHGKNLKVHHADFRKGDIRFSRADISKAQKMLAFTPEYGWREGLKKTSEWYVKQWK